MQKVLQFLGLEEVVAAERFQPNVGNLSIWGGATTVTTSDAAGYHVDRARLDAALRRHARQSGVADVRGSVRRVTLGDPREIECERADGTTSVYRATFVLDCSGRAGVVGRRMFNRETAGYRTVAFIGEWSTHQWPADETHRTVIESYAEGWAWSIPLDSTRRQCTVMWDPERSRGASLDDEYLAQLRNAPNLARRLAGGKQLSRVWTCDATVYQTGRMTDERLLLVGDAASFVETLSSAGVRKAMISAWRAAIVVNTLLHDHTMSTAACAFFEERERHMLSTCVDGAAGFFDEAARAYDTEFWRSRAMSRALVRPDPHASSWAAHSVAIRTAFERLVGASDDLRFAAGDDLRFGTAPEVDGRVLVRRQGVIFRGESVPTVFAGGVALAPLARLALQSRGMEALLAHYERQIGPVAPDELLTALSLLLGRGALVQTDAAHERARFEDVSPTGV
jgi:flavin-dependent dehydrogenase